MSALPAVRVGGEEYGGSRNLRISWCAHHVVRARKPIRDAWGCGCCWVGGIC